MKKALMICFCLCLVGCTQTPVEEEPVLPIASLFNQTGTGDIWQGNDVLRVFDEFKVMSEYELSQIDVVYNQDEVGYEFTIKDSEALKQISEYFLKASQEAVINLAEDYETVDNQKAFVFKVSFMDKEPVYFKGSEGYFCVTNSECVQYSYDHVLPRLKEFEENSKEVVAINLNEANTRQINWTSIIELPVKPSESSNELLVHWGLDILDSKTRAQQMTLYIKEDMNSLSDITKWESIIGGLTILALEDSKYYERNTTNEFVGPYQDRLPFELPVEEGFQGRVYAVSYQSVLNIGKQILGEAFEMPEVGLDLVNIAAYTVKHIPELKCFIVYSNYESETSTSQGEVVSIEENADQVTTRILLFSKGINYDTGEAYYVNSNGDVFDTYLGNEEKFDEVQITLTRNEDKYQVSAFKVINDIHKELIENEEGQEPSDVEETN